jgi:hypothetical protein
MLSNNTPTTIDLAGSSIMTVAPSPVFSGRIEVRYYDRAAWASFGTQLSADQARQLAAALVAQADALEVATTEGLAK